MRGLLTRMSVVAAAMSVASLLGMSMPAAARQKHEQQQDQNKDKDKEAQDKKKPQARPRQAEGKGPQQKAPPERTQPKTSQAPRQEPQGQPRRPAPRPQDAPPEQAQTRRPQRLPQPQQQQRIAQQRQWLMQYGVHLEQQQRLASQHSQQLQQQKRSAQYRFQQQYIARLRDQLLRLRNARNYNYGGDPYFYTAPNYRYARSGRYYETNDYGARILQQAVTFGYQEGFEAGQADRQDRWAFSYQDSYAYQDGNYGYDGFYVDRDEYNYYFREGFRRGYEDGYYGRNQYGVYEEGRYTILGAVLSVIINFEPLR